MANTSAKPLIDDDGEVSELTAADFAGARPAREVLPELLSPEVAAELLKPRGRTRQSQTKVHLNLRLSPEVVEYFKTSGRGWQNRMDEILKDWAKSHPRR